MAEIVSKMPYNPPHDCYKELYSAQYEARDLGYGSILQCSCNRFYELIDAGPFLSFWYSLTGRDHVTFAGGTWDQFKRVYPRGY